MYIKLTNGEIEQFPYTLGNFRRDNPHTSFPKQIGNSLLARENIYPVTTEAHPEFNSMVQSLVRNDSPHKEVLTRQIEDEANEGEFISESYETGRWVIGHTVVNKLQDEAEDAVRNQRGLLLSATDWMALSDNALSTEWTTYRQDLRDLPNQEGFPYSVTFPVIPA